MGSKLTVRGIVFSALFAALAVVLSWVSVNLGFSPVPITLGNMAVMMAGAFLGGAYGFFSMLLIVVLTALGLPMFHGKGGIDLLLGPTGGYVIAYPFCALLTGYFVTRVKGDGFLAFVKILLATFAFGSLLCYMTGVPWLAFVAKISISKAMVNGCYPFLIGDFAKAVVTALIVMQVRKIFPASRLVGTGGSKVVVL